MKLILTFLIVAALTGCSLRKTPQPKIPTSACRVCWVDPENSIYCGENNMLLQDAIKKVKKNKDVLGIQFSYVHCDRSFR